MKAMPIAIWEMLDDLFGLIERRWRIVVSLGVVLGGLVLLNSIVSLGEVFSFKTWGIPEQDDRATLSEVVRNLGLLAVGIVGLAFGIWRAWTAHLQTITAQDQAATAIRQAEIAEQGHLTDRFNMAVEQLGSSEQTVRIGGVYALWRIANDSPERDQQPVWDILCAFVRQPPVQRYIDDFEMMPGRRNDIQTIMNLLSSFDVAMQMANRNYVLRFDGADLSEIDLRNFILVKASFIRSDLTNAKLDGANLTEGDFVGANLTQASLYDADLTHAKLSGADLTRARIANAIFHETSIYSTNLSSAGGLTQEQIDNTHTYFNHPPHSTRLNRIKP